MRRPTLIVMVKEPRAGRVKTRLGQDIGMTGAAWWYRHQVRRLCRRLDDPRWRLVLSVAPDTAMESRAFPAHLSRMPQGNGDLGQRMARALGATTGPTVLIGSDIPGVAPRHVARAFRLLGSAPSVVGPATDGGYWLVGLRHPSLAPLQLFEGVRWSHPGTRAETMATLPRPVAVADTLRDVDTARDLC